LAKNNDLNISVGADIAPLLEDLKTAAANVETFSTKLKKPLESIDASKSNRRLNKAAQDLLKNVEGLTSENARNLALLERTDKAYEDMLRSLKEMRRDRQGLTGDQEKEVDHTLRSLAASKQKQRVENARANIESSRQSHLEALEKRREAAARRRKAIDTEINKASREALKIAREETVGRKQTVNELTDDKNLRKDIKRLSNELLAGEFKGVQLNASKRKLSKEERDLERELVRTNKEAFQQRLQDLVVERGITGELTNQANIENARRQQIVDNKKLAKRMEVQPPRSPQEKREAAVALQHYTDLQAASAAMAKAYGLEGAEFKKFQKDVQNLSKETQTRLIKLHKIKLEGVDAGGKLQMEISKEARARLNSIKSIQGYNLVQIETIKKQVEATGAITTLKGAWQGLTRVLRSSDKETDETDRSFRGLWTRLKEGQKALRGIRKSWSLSQVNLVNFAKNLRKAGRDMAKFQLTPEGENFAEVFKRLDKATIRSEKIISKLPVKFRGVARAARRLFKQDYESKLARELVRTNTNLLNIRKTFKDLRAGVRDFGSRALGSFKSMSKGADGSTGALSKLTKSLTGVDIKLRQFIGRIVIINGVWKTWNAVLRLSRELLSQIVEFDQQLQNIQAITVATAAQIRTIGIELLELSIRTPFAPAELAKAFTLLGQAGFSAEEALKAINSVAAVSIGTLASTEDTVKLLTTAIRAFDREAGEAAEVADVLVAAVNNSKLTIEGLNTAFNFAGPAASAAGLSIAQTAAALGVMADQGIRFSTQGTGLRQVLASFINPTASFRNELDKVGVSLSEVNPVTNDFGDILLRLKQAGFDVDSAFKGLEKRTAGAALAMVKGAHDFQSLEEQLLDTKAATLAMETQMTGLQKTFDRIKQRVLALANTPEIREFLKKLAQSVSVVVDHLENLINSLSNTKTGVQSAFTATGFVIEKFIATTKALGDQISKIGVTASLAIGAFLLIVAGPIGGAIGGLIRFGGVFRKLSLVIFSVLAELGIKLTAVFAIFGSLKTFATEPTNALADAVKRIRIEAGEAEPEVRTLIDTIEDLARVKLSRENVVEELDAILNNFLPVLHKVTGRDFVVRRLGEDFTAELEKGIKNGKVDQALIDKLKGPLGLSTLPLSKIVDALERLNEMSPELISRQQSVVITKIRQDISGIRQDLTEPIADQASIIKALTQLKVGNLVDARKKLKELKDEFEAAGIAGNQSARLSLELEVLNQTKVVEDFEREVIGKMKALAGTLPEGFNKAFDQLRDEFTDPKIDFGTRRLGDNIQETLDIIKNAARDQLTVIARTTDAQVARIEAVREALHSVVDKGLVLGEADNAALNSALTELGVITGNIRATSLEARDAIADGRAQLEEILQEGLKKGIEGEAISLKDALDAVGDFELPSSIDPGFEDSLADLTAQTERASRGLKDLRGSFEDTLGFLRNRISTIEEIPVGLLTPELVAELDSLIVLVGVYEAAITKVSAKQALLLKQRESKLTAAERTADQEKAALDIELDRLRVEEARHAKEFEHRKNTLELEKSLNPQDAVRIEKELRDLQIEKIQRLVIESRIREGILQKTIARLTKGDRELDDARTKLLKDTQDKVKLEKIVRNDLAHQLDLIDAQGDALFGVNLAWLNIAQTIQQDVNGAIADAIIGAKSLGDVADTIKDSLKRGFRDGLKAALDEKLQFDKIFEGNMLDLGKFAETNLGGILGKFGGGISVVGPDTPIEGAEADILFPRSSGSGAGAAGGFGTGGGAGSALLSAFIGAEVGKLLGIDTTGAALVGGGVAVAGGALAGVGGLIGAHVGAAQGLSSLAALTGPGAGGAAIGATLGPMMIALGAFFILKSLLSSRSVTREFFGAVKKIADPIFSSGLPGFEVPVTKAETLDRNLRREGINVPGREAFSTETSKVLERRLSEDGIADPKIAKQLRELSLALGVTFSSGAKSSRAFGLALAFANQALLAMLKRGQEIKQEDLDKIYEKAREELGSFGAVIESVNKQWETQVERGEDTQEQMEFLADAVAGAALIFADDFPKGVDIARKALRQFTETGQVDLAALQSEVEAVIGATSGALQSILSEPLKIALDGKGLAPALETLQLNLNNTIQGAIVKAFEDAFIAVAVKEGLLTPLFDVIQDGLSDLAVNPDFDIDDFINGIENTLGTLAPAIQRIQGVFEEAFTGLASVLGGPIQGLTKLFGERGDPLDFIKFDRENVKDVKDFTLAYSELKLKVSQLLSLREDAEFLTGRGDQIVQTKRDTVSARDLQSKSAAQLATYLATFGEGLHENNPFPNENQLLEMAHDLAEGKVIDKRFGTSPVGNNRADVWTFKGSLEGGLEIRYKKGFTTKVLHDLSSDNLAEAIFGEGTTAESAKFEKLLATKSVLTNAINEREKMYDRLFELTGISIEKLNKKSKELFGKDFDNLFTDQQSTVLAAFGVEFDEALADILTLIKASSKDVKKALTQLGENIFTADQFVAFFQAVNEAFDEGIIKNRAKVNKLIQSGIDSLEESLPAAIDVQRIFQDSLDADGVLDASKFTAAIKGELIAFDFFTKGLTAAINAALTSGSVQKGVDTFTNFLKKSLGDAILAAIVEGLVNKIFIDGIIGPFMGALTQLLGAGAGPNAILLFISEQLPDLLAAIGDTADNVLGPILEMILDLFADTGLLDGYGSVIDRQENLIQEQLKVAEVWQDIVDQVEDVRRDILFGDDEGGNIKAQIAEAEAALQKQLAIFRNPSTAIEAKQEAAREIVELISTINSLGGEAADAGLGDFQRESLPFQKLQASFLGILREVETAAIDGASQLDILQSQLDMLQQIADNTGSGGGPGGGGIDRGDLENAPTLEAMILMLRKLGEEDLAARLEDGIDTEDVFAVKAAGFDAWAIQLREALLGNAPDGFLPEEDSTDDEDGENTPSSPEYNGPGQALEDPMYVHVVNTDGEATEGGGVPGRGRQQIDLNTSGGLTFSANANTLLQVVFENLTTIASELANMLVEFRSFNESLMGVLGKATVLAAITNNETVSPVEIVFNPVINVTTTEDELAGGELADNLVTELERQIKFGSIHSAIKDITNRKVK